MGDHGRKQEGALTIIAIGICTALALGLAASGLFLWSRRHEEDPDQEAWDRLAGLDSD